MIAGARVHDLGEGRVDLGCIARTDVCGFGFTARFDDLSHHGPWTADTLRLIQSKPATRAADLAASVGRETAPFKLDVRKLKNLGLTYSLETGYELSPRGIAYLDALGN